MVRADGELFLVHDPGDGEVRIRIANRAKAYLYCVEVEDPNTGWRVPLAPSWVISKNYRTVARLVPDHANRRFEIEVERRRRVTKLSKRPHAAPSRWRPRLRDRRRAASDLNGAPARRGAAQEPLPRPRGGGARPAAVRVMPQPLQRHRRQRPPPVGAERHRPAARRRVPGAALCDPVADARRPAVLHRLPATRTWRARSRSRSWSAPTSPTGRLRASCRTAGSSRATRPTSRSERAAGPTGTTSSRRGIC